MVVLRQIMSVGVAIVWGRYVGWRHCSYLGITVPYTSDNSNVSLLVNKKNAKIKKAVIELDSRPHEMELAV